MVAWSVVQTDKSTGLKRAGRKAARSAVCSADSKAERTARSSVEHLVGLRAVVSAGYWVAQRAAR